MLKNKYGYFTRDGLEYVITDPRTPRPWFNYMWNDNYAGLISHTGGGFSYMETPRDNRLTRMRYNCLPWDRPGRYVIIKDKQTGKYWSLSWAPTIEKKYDLYECRHGLGYTKIITQKQKIRSEITYFVPTDMNGEIWHIRLKNLSGKKRKLEIYSFTELLMGNALNDIINQPNDKHFTEIKFDKKNESLVCSRRYWVLNKRVSVAQPNTDWSYNLLFTTSLPVSGFDGSLDNFIGKWRSESNPISIEKSKMANTEITSGDPVAALQSEITLEKNSEIEFAVIIAVVPKNDENPFAAIDIQKLKKIKNIKEKFEGLKNKWTNSLSSFNAKTPDPKFNLSLNVWNQYQAAVTFDMARNSGYYHGGLLFGTGMRDQFQDILGVVMSDPQRVRKRLLNALRFQFSNGSTLHNYFKITEWGEKTNHSDTPLWIPFGIIEYLNETADLTILDEVVKFYDDGEATVYEHMKLALDFAISACTDRGLPKIMNGDWNDTLDHIGPGGKGETVWGAFFLGYIIRKTFELLELRQDQATLEKWKKKYEELRKVINEHCWDGKWYLRAFRDDGTEVGSSKHKQGRIFINSQSWAVISGLAPTERSQSSMKSGKKFLTTPYGMQIVYPSYTEVEDRTGLISRCVPGKKENGAVFNHASSWFVLASIMNNDIDFAYDTYTKMLPTNSSRNIDRYEVEPYVFAEYVTSPDHETENQASHSWLTGTAVWMLRIGIDHICGFKTSIKGMTIDPHIPSKWKKFSAERNFRGKKIMLKVDNPERKNSGIRMMKINDKVVDSNEFDPSEFPGSEISVKVILG